MTGNLEFDHLVEALPQVPKCAHCGLLSPFVRPVWSYSQGTTGVAIELCFWCSSPVHGEYLKVPRSLRRLIPLRVSEVDVVGMYTPEHFGGTANPG